MKLRWHNNTPATLEDVQSCVGAGWGGIISTLLEQLEALGWDGRIGQVKEKFGGLRFYIPQCSDILASCIAAAEEESEVTCDVCGEPGEIGCTYNWYKCLCPAHRKI